MIGLRLGATEDQIKSNFYDLAKKYHPDSYDGLSDTEKVLNEETFKRLSIAYDVLKDS
jgi:curved DNA-binding protein CbpA